MKLTLAQLQLMECILNSLSYRYKIENYSIVIKLEPHIVKCKFFKDYSEITPMINTNNSCVIRQTYLNQDTQIRKISNEFYSNLSNEYTDFRQLSSYPDLLLKYLYEKVVDHSNLEPVQDCIYNVDFLLQDKHFDFYYLDTSSKYEVVSLIQVW